SFRCSCVSGLSGVDETVFISSGENVRLPCNNALPDCKSTTWNYNRFSHSSAVELIAGGIKKNNTESHKRLSLGSDCSLNIKNITKEDYGSYICQQWTVNGQKLRTDARAYLHVLHVSSSSSSSSQTEFSAGLSVTLFCQLYSYDEVSCDAWIRSEGIHLFWVNQAGDKLTRSDSRYQISAPDHCISNLTTTLLNEDLNREWRCEVTHRDQLKTSATYTFKSSGEKTISSSVLEPHNVSKTEDCKASFTLQVFFCRPFTRSFNCDPYPIHEFTLAILSETSHMWCCHLPSPHTENNVTCADKTSHNQQLKKKTFSIKKPSK
uniref:Ig-like domain-containing protein n=1 Tax=Cyprinus carpio TaxID=7962 RepID=A0A8C1UCH6_CYPCA